MGPPDLSPKELRRRKKSFLFDSSTLKSRRAMYWGAPDRTYRLTRQEQESGNAMCPKCRKDMEVQPFTKKDKLYVCPSCGFKVPRSKAVTKIEIGVEDGEVTDVDVTTAGKSRRGSKVAFVDMARLGNLPSMSLSDIAMVVYDDWANVNYAAKPYLEALQTLEKITDNYMMDSGADIVARFVGNSSSWRGPVAVAVKKELNRRLKVAH